MIKIRDVEETIAHLSPKKLDQFRRWFTKFDPAYQLGREILEAEEQIKRKDVVSWSATKRKHKL